MILKRISGILILMWILSGRLVADTTHTFFGGTITNSGFGGPAIKLTSYQGHLAVMDGGRGAGIINHHFTLGGAGYGILNSIPLWSPSPDTSRFLKMGYGGLEFGYIFFPERRMYFGVSLLAGAGALFWQSQSHADGAKLVLGDDFQIFAVMEPTIYGVLKLTRFMGLNAGLSYRFARGAESAHFHDRDLRELSVYLGLLFGKV